MNTSENHENMDDSTKVTPDFKSVIKDFINDILHSFPEYNDNLHEDLYNIKDCATEERLEDSYNNIYEYVKTIYPERFFDILYKNVEMFDNEDINTMFLPDIEFKTIWKCDISDGTRNTIWKYLQVILFSIIGDIKSGDSFGDTAKLFEAINEEDLQKQLQDTLGNLQNMMDGEESFDLSGVENLPNPNDIQQHIHGLMDGKLGNLAKEIAEETANDLNMDMEGATSMEDVMKGLFQNPGKLMGLVNKVGSKLDNKLKSGEINESEIMQEASELMGKMKDMPGMNDIQGLLGKMGMGNIPGMNGGDNTNGMPDLTSMMNMMGQSGLGGSGEDGNSGPDMSNMMGNMMSMMGNMMGGGRRTKVNSGAMQNALNQYTKKEEKRQKILNRIEDKRQLAIENEKNKPVYDESALKAEAEAEAKAEKMANELMNDLIFSTGENVEKTPRAQSSVNKKKKKAKKNKK